MIPKTLLYVVFFGFFKKTKGKRQITDVIKYILLTVIFKTPSKIPTIVSPPILDICLALIKIANREAAEAEIDNLIHNESTAVIPKELKNEKASNILIPRNSLFRMLV